MNNNISLKGEDIKLDIGSQYYVIDALYLNELKEGIDNLQRDILDEEIESKIFPYTEAPFAKVIPSKDSFQVRSIKKADREELPSEERYYFSCDTELILFIKESQLEPFIKKYNYDDLVDSLTEEINSEHWKQITEGILQNDIGLILSPGIDSGFEFEGSGFYKITS
ncbi:hypothetical protein LVD17_03045 [Fulvivirga ulvae]|uniref:hypothetical protein n=1 Tax=Fulvivirga ulvae TaxID=2904245 RepID=UPI001F1D8C5C|nr:hypothetical protein [Fulvivirga ulvae]UII32808.1 hypothetical protein LVD17_03045 [Fulvivirga ulvae]